MLQRACFLLFVFALTAAAQAPKAQYPPTDWPIENGSFDILDFSFGNGETLPKLHLHYLTLGKLHRDVNGHADNAVLLLHGTGGNALLCSTPPSPRFSSAPASRSTSLGTSLFSPTTLVTASPAKPPMAST